MPRSAPRFSSSSITTRCSRASDPWWAFTSSSPASSLRLAANRSAWRRALQKMMVLRCASTWASTAGYTLSQMLPISSTGTTTSTSICLRVPASTMLTLRRRPSGPWPPRKWATSSSGRCVADSPMRWGGRAVMASSRSSDSMRWAPRLVVAIAWISSMMTVSTLTSVSATDDVSMRYRLSGVVINRSTGCRINACRSFGEVSPVRMATVGWRNGTPEAFGGQPDAHQRGAQVLLDVEGQRPQRRDVQHPRAALRDPQARWCTGGRSRP